MLKNICIHTHGYMYQKIIYKRVRALHLYSKATKLLSFPSFVKFLRYFQESYNANLLFLSFLSISFFFFLLHHYFVLVSFNFDLFSFLNSFFFSLSVSFFLFSFFLPRQVKPSTPRTHTYTYTNL